MVYYIQYLSKYILRLDLCQLHSKLVNSKNTRRYQKHQLENSAACLEDGAVLQDRLPRKAVASTSS